MYDGTIRNSEFGPDVGTSEPRRGQSASPPVLPVRIRIASPGTISASVAIPGNVVLNA